MSTSHSQETRPDQAGKRRKRKERAATRAPEPKNIVSGAGQPLDLSVRRELEERLGHDFGRVRLHTDRDAGALTEMLGADAVAVGQDIFFREGAYRPGTPDGQRLLAHELLHTVQNPHGLGALRAGRDLGEVSLPQQAMEREAESAAQESVRDGEAGTQVEEGQSTPGWLRYATVDADRNRLEQIDPATLVERLANSVVRSLRGDPEDRSKRTRRQLARLPEELQDTVLERLETRLLSSEHERLLDLVDEVEAYDDLERSSLDAPAAESDPVGELRYERETAQRSAEEQREEERQPAPAPGPEKDQEDEGGAPGSTPENGSSRGSGEQGQRQGQGRDPGAASAAPAAAPRQQASSASSGSASSSPSGGGAETAGSGEGKEGQEQQGAPAASREESAARNRPGAVDALVAGQQLKPEDKGGSEKPTGSPSAAGKDAQLSGAFGTLDGVRAQDLDGPEEKSDDIPFGTGSASEVEVGGGEPSAWDVTLRPEDFLPTQDLDVSAVPTAPLPRLDSNQ
ncbi:eCIS core domain-containing protein [Streptomyces clavifer]